MSGAAAQGAEGGSAAANNQPTAVDDGFTAEERAQFEAMERGVDGQVDDGAGGGSDADQSGGADGGQAGAQAGADAAAAAAGGKVIVEEDDDDEGADAQGAGAQQGQQNADGTQRPPPRRVNYKKYERVEKERDDLKKERDDLKTMFARADERMKLITEALSGENKAKQAAAEDADPEPDKEKDVFGWMNWAGRQMANMQQMVKEQRQQTEVSGEERRTADTYVADVQRFVGADPNGKNFGPAYNFLMTQRYAELALFHFGKDLVDDATGAVDLTKLTGPELAKVKADTAAEERELVTGALARGESPAASVYRMARTRGFRAQAAQNGAASGQQGAQGAQNGAGGTKAPGNLADGAQGGSGGQQQGRQNGANGNGQQQPNVADEIRKVREGQAASVSLSNGAGSPGQQALTPERLANMSQDEFNAMMEDMGDGAFRRLMGG